MDGRDGTIVLSITRITEMNKQAEISAQVQAAGIAAQIQAHEMMATLFQGAGMTQLVAAVVAVEVANERREELIVQSAALRCQD